jgi:hypothetical protein
MGRILARRAGGVDLHLVRFLGQYSPRCRKMRSFEEYILHVVYMTTNLCQTDMCPVVKYQYHSIQAIHHGLDWISQSRTVQPDTAVDLGFVA